MPNLGFVPLVNGVNYSWIDISLIMFGVPSTAIVEINYKRKQKKENNYGAGAYPISRGYGEYEYEGDITIYTDYWKAIIAGAPNRDPLQIPWFSIPVVYGSSRTEADLDTLEKVEFLEDPLATKQGDTKILVKIPLIIGNISR